MEPDPIRGSYEAVLNDLRGRRDRDIQEATARIAQKYDVLIAAMEAAVDGGLEVFASSTTGVSDTAGLGPIPLNAPIRIMTGEFHGMSYTSAARSILERSPNKAPLTTQEILGYILKSGRKVEGKNPAGTIYSSLKRGPDFELVAKNTWGLAAWYNVKRKPKPDKSGEVQESEPPIFSDKDTPIASEMELQEVG